MLENGMFLIERYEILSKVGAGGMSDVYKAKDHVLGRIVAVKVLKAEFSEDVNFVTKFRTEAQSAAGLEHPNIVNIYDVGSENGLHFIVMEYVEGITLKTYVEKKGQLSFKEATSIAIQVARGIEIAHSKEIIHRDIKPQNVIISTEGKVKVTDFGIARAISSNTISAEVMGSVHYASPEQARNGFVDGRSDIYSLGIVMYEMVTGRVPFDGDTTVSVAIQHLQEEMVEPSAYAPELPISYEKIVLKATQKNPDRRYQTIEELLADLRKALANPEEDFVVIAPATVAKTRVIGGEELEAIQNSAANADLEKENAFANTQDDDELDSYDDLDDDEDEDKGFLNPIVDRVINIVLILFAIAIVGVIIWLGSSVLELFNKPGDNNPTTSKPPVSSTTQPGSSESETTEEPSSTEEPTTKEEYVEVPNIVGMDKERAEAWLKDKGLIMNIIAHNPDSDKPEGTVLSQSELEGASVLVGTTIHVTVAGDEAVVIKKEVPDVVGMDEQTARDTLKAHGFEVEVDWEYSNDIAVDLVSSQNPNGGKDVKQGSKVTIYISKGKAPTAVPDNLVGMDVEVATYILEQAGFTVKVSYEYVSKDETEDLVLRVPLAGETVDYGSEVEIIVSIHEEEPSSSEPPESSEPGTSEPGTSEPGTDEPSTSEPGTDEPDSNEPESSEPVEKVYEYSSIISRPSEAATATLYTYVLKDADGNVISEAKDPLAIPEDGKIIFKLKNLSSSSKEATLEITWYAEVEGPDNDGDGNPDVTKEVVHQSTGTPSLKDVTPIDDSAEEPAEPEV